MTKYEKLIELFTDENRDVIAIADNLLELKCSMCKALVESCTSSHYCKNDILNWLKKRKVNKCVDTQKIEIKMRDFEQISNQEASYIIKSFDKNIDLKGLYYTINVKSGKFIAIDNSTGDCWVEDFHTLEDCLEYLRDSEKVEIYE